MQATISKTQWPGCALFPACSADFCPMPQTFSGTSVPWLRSLVSIRLLLLRARKGLSSEQCASSSSETQRLAA